MFSLLTDSFHRPQNPLYAALSKLHLAGTPLIDLVSGNPTINGIRFPAALLGRLLAQSVSSTTVYQPNPLGSIPAREAIARFYKQPSLHGAEIVLTPGTSLSYWYLFKLLGQPGDEFLVPRPTYPLFEEIARVADVRLQYYRLHPRERWKIDLQQMEDHITERTRGIILVSPHNPTGAVATREELAGIADLASRRNIPVIIDEVFSPFTFDGSPFYRPFDQVFPLLFTLNGLSKMFALAGAKLGWIAVTGDRDRVGLALKGLEHLSDLFLPVNEFVQAAVPDLLKEALPFAAHYHAVVKDRQNQALGLLHNSESFTWIEPRGGFYLPLQFRNPKVQEDDMALKVLLDHQILVHPGHFYELPPGYLVLSYLAEPPILRSAIQTLERVCR